MTKRIYKGSLRRTLLIDDGSSSGWKETDSFPLIGDCELLIKDIQIPKNLRAFIEVLRDYYANQREATFFFLEEEDISGREPIDAEFDLASLDEISKLMDEAPNLNRLLFDVSFTWALKLHHESIGYFTGSTQICDALKNSVTLSQLLSDPVWQPD